jgi:hypothetical protein
MNANWAPEQMLMNANFRSCTLATEPAAIGMETTSAFAQKAPEEMGKSVIAQRFLRTSLILLEWLLVSN